MADLTRDYLSPVDLDALVSMLDDRRLLLSGPAERYMRQLIEETRVSRGRKSPAQPSCNEQVSVVAKDQLKAWKALAEKATPGPWYQSRQLAYALNERGTNAATMHCELEDAEDNAAFITASREAIPALIAEVERQAARVAVLEAALRKLMLGYVNLLEKGRDRICWLGGGCDPVDVMERADPALRAARAALGGKL